MIIGTRWHNDDIYGWLFELNAQLEKAGKLREMYDVRRKGCFDGPDGLYFPTRLTMEFLEEQRLSMDDKEFACQYLNQPLSEEMQLFPASMIRRFDADFDASGAVPYLLMQAPA